MLQPSRKSKVKVTRLAHLYRYTSQLIHTHTPSAHPHTHAPAVLYSIQPASCTRAQPASCTRARPGCLIQYTACFMRTSTGKVCGHRHVHRHERLRYQRQACERHACERQACERLACPHAHTCLYCTPHIAHHTHTHTHTRTHTHTHTQKTQKARSAMASCVCVCVCVYLWARSAMASACPACAALRNQKVARLAFIVHPRPVV